MFQLRKWKLEERLQVWVFRIKKQFSTNPWLVVLVIAGVWIAIIHVTRRSVVTDAIAAATTLTLESDLNTIHHNGEVCNWV